MCKAHLKTTECKAHLKTRRGKLTHNWQCKAAPPHSPPKQGQLPNSRYLSLPRVRCPDQTIATYKCSCYVLCSDTLKIIMVHRKNGEPS